MGLDFGWTCPDIDKNIVALEESLTDNIDSILDECCPLLTGEQKSKFIKDWVDHIMVANKDLFEDLRKTNSDLRDQAEKQIGDLETKVDELEFDLESANQEIETLQNI